MTKETITIPRLNKAPKKKTTKKTEDKQQTFLTVDAVQYGYNALANSYLKSLEGTWFGESIPTDPEEQAKFWKDKLDKERNKTASLKEQVELLKGMILVQMNRDGGRSDY